MNHLGQGQEVPVLAFLSGLVVVGIGGEDAMDAADLAEPLGEPQQGPGRIVCAARPYRDSSRSCIDDDLDRLEPLIFVERCRFAGRTASHQKVDTGADLPIDECAQSRLIDRTSCSVRQKRRDERCATSYRFHYREVYK